MAEERRLRWPLAPEVSGADSLQWRRCNGGDGRQDARLMSRDLKEKTQRQRAKYIHI